MATNVKRKKKAEVMSDDGSMTLTGHLKELRNRLIICAAVFVVGVIGFLAISDKLIDLLTAMAMEGCPRRNHTIPAAMQSTAAAACRRNGTWRDRWLCERVEHQQRSSFRCRPKASTAIGLNLIDINCLFTVTSTSRSRPYSTLSRQPSTRNAPGVPRRVNQRKVTPYLTTTSTTC